MSRRPGILSENFTSRILLGCAAVGRLREAVGAGLFVGTAGSEASYCSIFVLHSQAGPMESLGRGMCEGWSLEIRHCLLRLGRAAGPYRAAINLACVGERRLFG